MELQEIIAMTRRLCEAPGKVRVLFEKDFLMQSEC